LFFLDFGAGDAVGLCQSGAIGRASAGQGFEDIIRAYFPGVEMSQLKY
jgi:peptidoglycan hydrolase-like amidase